MHAFMPIQHRASVVAYVPWSIFTPEDEVWADKNHRQTLDGLASRSGLGICELVAILDHSPWRAMKLSEGWCRLFQIFAERQISFQPRT